MAKVATITQYVKDAFNEQLGKYGANEVADIDIMAEDYVFNIQEEYELGDMYVNIKAFLDERIAVYVEEYKKSNLFRYPLQDDSGELIAVLETFLTRGEVLAIVDAFRQGDGVEFGEFMAEEGIVVIGGFETKIDWM
jgi:hypothetical protein